MKLHKQLLSVVLAVCFLLSFSAFAAEETTDQSSGATVTLTANPSTVEAEGSFQLEVGVAGVEDALITGGTITLSKAVADEEVALTWGEAVYGEGFAAASPVPSEDPSASEEPAVSEEPVSSEEPATSEEPTTSEQPSATDGSQDNTETQEPELITYDFVADEAVPISDGTILFTIPVTVGALTEEDDVVVDVANLVKAECALTTAEETIALDGDETVVQVTVTPAEIAGPKVELAYPVKSADHFTLNYICEDVTIATDLTLSDDGRLLIPTVAQDQPAFEVGKTYTVSVSGDGYLSSDSVSFVYENEESIDYTVTDFFAGAVENSDRGIDVYDFNDICTQIVEEADYNIKYDLNRDGKLTTTDVVCLSYGWQASLNQTNGGEK